MFDNDLWLLDFKLILHFYRKNFKQFDFVQENVDEWTAFLVVDGVFHYELDGLCSGEAHEGEMVLCPPGCTFKRRTITMVSLHVMRFELRDSSGALCGQNKKVPSGAMRFSSSEKYTSTVDLLSSISADDIYSVNVYKEHLLRDIWLLMCYETSALSCYAGVPDTQDVVMRDILYYIKANVSRKLVMRDIAREFGISPVVLQRRFTRAFNITPGAYLSRLKLEKAKRLLSDTDKRIIEIAVICGFENEYYFSKAFKRETGLSPSGFRKLV